MGHTEGAQCLRNIRRDLKVLEQDLLLLETLRSLAKTESGRLTVFGRRLIALFKEEENVKQSFVAGLLEITPGAVSQHYARKDE